MRSARNAALSSTASLTSAASVAASSWHARRVAALRGTGWPCLASYEWLHALQHSLGMSASLLISGCTQGRSIAWHTDGTSPQINGCTHGGSIAWRKMVPCFNSMAARTAAALRGTRCLASYHVLHAMQHSLALVPRFKSMAARTAVAQHRVAHG